jgi:hypothetical protein
MARKRLGLKPAPTLLVLGGGLGMGPLVETMKELDKSSAGFQMLVVAGRNPELEKKLSAQRFRHPVKVFGFVTNMQELMAASDVIVTKPGGLTASEALALGKPMLIVNPLPGQEAANSDFLLERGAAVKANRLEDLSYRVSRLMAGPPLARMRKAAQTLGRPRAAAQIVKAVGRLLGVFLIGVLLGAPVKSWAGCSIALDEEVIFFPSLATWDAAGKTWHVDIHGWIFEPETDSLKRRLLLDAFSRRLEISQQDSANLLFQNRARYFLVDNERKKTLEIQFQDKRYTLQRSDAGGHVKGRISLPQLKAGPWLSYQTVPCSTDARVFSGSVRVAEPQGLVVVSDLDDTIKVSEVLERKKLLANTFLKEYQAVPGMAEVYSRWAAKTPGTLFYYLSASPWQLFPDLQQFLTSAGFPEGVWFLKRFRWKDRTFFSLFQDPEAYKIPVLEKLFQTFPQRKFILVGDAGERDPEIYAAAARRFPAKIEHIYIRDAQGLTPSERLAAAFQGLDANLWTVFRQSEELQ